MRFKRTKSNCSECPLRDQKRVWGTGPTDPRICLLGEAPGADEARLGEPFVGAAGGFLNWGLSQVDLLRHRLWVTNTICCRPPGNNYLSDEAQEAVKCCKPGFREEMAWLKNQGMKIIGALGNHPMEFLEIGESKITAARGFVYKSPYGPVIPTFHPSHLNRMRGAGSKEKGSPTYKWVWLADLAKIKEYSTEDYVPIKEDFNIFPSVGDVEKYVMARIENHDLIAVDVETTGLNPRTSDLFVIGLAHSATEGISIPIFKNPSGNYWCHNGDEVEVFELVQKLFDNCDLMFQNSLYDVRHLNHGGFNISWQRVKHDTLLLHHAISPELPHNLEFIVSIYGQTPKWKEVFAGRYGSIFSLPDEDVRTYNLRDCVVLHQILPEMLEELAETGAEKTYYNYSMKILEPICDMMETGLLLDKQGLAEFKKITQKQMEELEKKLYLLGQLPSVFNLASDDDLRYFIYGYLPNKLKTVEEEMNSLARKDTKKYATLLAKKELKDKVRPLWLPGKATSRSTKSGKISVNQQALLGFIRQAQNRLATLETLKTKKQDEEKEIRSLLEWFDVYFEWASLDKILSTYTKYKTDADGRVRTSLLMHGTATGRPASRNPNLLNIPKGNKEIRKAFKAPEGRIFYAPDYSQFEVRITAYETGDQALIDLVDSGGNVHDANTRLMFGFEPEHPLWKEGRNAVKVGVFGGFTYGGGDKEIYERMVLKAPKLGLTFAQYKQAKDLYFREHPELAHYHERIKQQVLSTRKVSNAFGRSRYFYGELKDIVKEAYNFPIQSAAADIAGQALIRICEIIKEKGYKTKPVLYIYDELLFEVPLDELSEMSNIILTEMQREVDFRGRLVSFPVEPKMGVNWGELKEL